MTKVTGITASYARCKLSKNIEGLRRPLTIEDKIARTRRHPRPHASWRSLLPLLQMNAIRFFGLYYREELLRESACLRSREVRTKRLNQQIVDSEVHPTYIFSFNVGFTWRNCN